MPSLSRALQHSQWAGWQLMPLPADASARSYARLVGPSGETVIWMNSGPIPTAPFRTVAAFLLQHGFAVPQVLFHAEPHLILSDLGLTDLATALTRGGRPQDLYQAAVDMLIQLRDVPLPDLPVVTADMATDRIDPLFAFHAPTADRDAITSALHQLWQDHCNPLPQAFSMRDCHVENLIWRPDQTGIARIGILDFQDAEIWPAGYDLASLLRDPRRATPDTLVEEMTARYCGALDLDPIAFGAARAVLGVQRNLRILGIFAKLIHVERKQKYQQFLGSTWAAIQADLAHPALAKLRDAINHSVPAPEVAA